MGSKFQQFSMCCCSRVLVEPGALLFLHTDFPVKCLKCVLFSRIRGSLFTVCVHFFFFWSVGRVVFTLHTMGSAHTHTHSSTHSWSATGTPGNTSPVYSPTHTHTHTLRHTIFSPEEFGSVFLELAPWLVDRMRAQ